MGSSNLIYSAEWLVSHDCMNAVRVHVFGQVFMLKPSTVVLSMWPNTLLLELRYLKNHNPSEVTNVLWKVESGFEFCLSSREPYFVNDRVC